MGYITDLSDSQWKIVDEVLPKENRGKHFCKYSKRELVNAVLYIVKTGCQWRLLPNDFPPYPTVWSFYRCSVKSGLWDKILAALVEKVRVGARRALSPTLAIVDSQSVKTCYASKNRGIDGKKNEMSKKTHRGRYYGKPACRRRPRSQQARYQKRGFASRQSGRAISNHQSGFRRFRLPEIV